MNEKNRKPTVNGDQYATVADFKRIFTEDVNSLYLMSLLLTGDPDRAEQCFVEGIEESTRGNQVFKEWARSWARRTIIQSAIRLINPRQSFMTATRTANIGRGMDKIPIVLHSEVSAILELPPLDRFVFVMSVLERYSDNDCSILLGCLRRDIAPTRTRALQRLVTLLGTKESFRMEIDPETVTELMIAQYFATPAWTRNPAP